MTITRYIALLRAINVGGHFIKMEALRDHFEALGLDKVETFINSGNVIFETRAAKTSSLEKKIEAALRQALGYEVTTFIRSAAEFASLVAYQPPFPPLAAGGGLYVAFMQAPPEPAAHKNLAALETEIDRFHIHEREVYWWRGSGYSDSPLSSSGRFEKLLGGRTTVRNATTVQKLAAKYPQVIR